MSRNTEDRIPFHRPSLGSEEEAAVLRVLRSGWLTTAGEARAFEAEFAAAVGSAYAISVNSATSGLHLALEAAGVRNGGRVVTTPYTFTASAEVIRYLGADPVFVDIRGDDLNIDPDGIEQALAGAGNIQAIMPVHLGGHPCEMDRILSIANDYSVPVVEDAAHAFPGSFRGKPLGTIGDSGVFSFYATKTMTTGEGGMVVTDDPDRARRMSTMRLHGIDREVWDRYTSDRASWEYEVVEAGFKYNMPDILAAIGREQLRKSRRFLEARRRIAETYRTLLEDRDYLELPPDSPESSCHLYVVRLRLERLSIDRRAFVDRLAALGIGTSVHYIPLHLMPYYRDRYDLKPHDFPVSLDAYSRSISLPIYPELSDGQIARIAESVRRVGDGALGS